jgi:hypothetical protein
MITSRNNKIEPVSTIASATLLENWKFWMAWEVIEQIIVRNKVSITIEELVNKLALDENIEDHFANIHRHVKQYIKDLDLFFNSSEEIKVQIQQLDEHYLKKIYPEIHSLNDKLKFRKIDIFQRSLSHDYSHASPIHIIVFFQEFLETLRDKRRIYENQIKLSIKQRDSAQTALNKLHSNIGKSANLQGIKNALSIIYSCTLNIDMLTSYCQIINCLMVKCKSYHDSAKESLIILKRTAISVKNKCSINLVSFPVFTILNKVDIDRQRKLLEIWSGHHLNYFGNSPITWQQLESKLLRNLDPLVDQLFRDFQLVFEEHISRSSDYD